MKVVLISDTHGHESEVVLPAGDLLIHAGDWTVFGNVQHLNKFAMWVEKTVPHYPFGIVLIAGNHDIGMDPKFAKGMCAFNESLFTRIPNVHYLNDNYILITEGDKVWKIWGSPITPEFCNWAFNRDRGADIKRHWNLIPHDIDILVTHGPPKGVRDSGLGCSDLLQTVEGLAGLKLHVFGHIHPPYGKSKIDDRYYINAAQCLIEGNKYVLRNEPLTVELCK